VIGPGHPKSKENIDRHAACPDLESPVANGRAANLDISNVAALPSAGESDPRMILSNTRGAFLRSRTPWANVIAGVHPDAADERGRGASQQFTALTGCDSTRPPTT
jgi:hypothetical protein